MWPRLAPPPGGIQERGRDLGPAALPAAVAGTVPARHRLPGPVVHLVAAVGTGAEELDHALAAPGATMRVHHTLLQGWGISMIWKTSR